MYPLVAKLTDAGGRTDGHALLQRNVVVYKKNTVSQARVQWFLLVST